MKTLFLNLFVFCTIFSTGISIYACEYDFGKNKILQTLDLTIGNFTDNNTNYVYVKEKFNGVAAGKPTNIFITNKDTDAYTMTKNINRIISNESETCNTTTTISIYGKVKIKTNTVDYELQSYIRGKETGVNLVRTADKKIIKNATITVKDVTASTNSTNSTVSTDSNFRIYQITSITGTNDEAIYAADITINTDTLNTLKQKYAYGVNTTLTYVLPFANDTNTATLKWKLATDPDTDTAYKTLITVKNPKFYGQPTAVFGRNPLAQLTNIDEDTKITIQAYFSGTVDGIDWENSYTEEIYFNKAKKGLN